MNHHATGFRILIAILTLGSLRSVTVVNHHPDEEYFLQHEVLYEDAIAEAKKLEIYPGMKFTDYTAHTVRVKSPIPGCKPCTNAEMTYCENESVINDHCCCDGSFNEVFPFIKHTCREGPEECKVQAGDCAEYARLRECCCHSYLASVWKYRANGAQSNVDTCLAKFMTILVVLRFLV